MKITNLTKKDYKKAAKLYQEHYPCALKQVTKYMKLDGIHLIAKKKEITGMIVAPYSNMNSNIVEISFLAVKKDQRGKGVGSALLKNLEKKAKNKRAILSYSKSAISFYQKKGFKIIAEDEGGKYLFKRLHPKQ